MKFLLAGINHETNTFHSIPTKYENFEKSGMLLRGKEIEKLYDTPSVSYTHLRAHETDS